MKELTYEDWQKNSTPRMMWVWDDNEKEKIKRKVIYVLSGVRGRKQNVITLYTDESCTYAYAHCAEIESQRRMTDKEKAKSIIPYQEKGYIFDEDLHEIYFPANGELMVKASVVQELKAQIEKMKNCRYAYDEKHDCMTCENMEDWELM